MHWFVNRNLEIRFEQAKQRLTSLNIPFTERNLFHGTNEVNFDPILKVRSYMSANLRLSDTIGREGSRSVVSKDMG